MTNTSSDNEDNNNNTNNENTINSCGVPTTTTTTTTTTSTSSTSRRGFTEAVPLSLSSMAHMTMPLTDGVLDGLKMVLQHTLLSCLNYARAVYYHHSEDWTFRDLTTTQYAWDPELVVNAPLSSHDKKATSSSHGTMMTTTSTDLPLPPPSLTKHGFQYQYQRTCLVYLRPMMKGLIGSHTKQDELHLIHGDNWTSEEGVLAKITLLYTSTSPMTDDELEGPTGSIDDDDDDYGGGVRSRSKNNKKTTKTVRGRKRKADEVDRDDDDDDDDDDGSPPKYCVLYKVLVEYRSIPATGKAAAVKAEELSMLSFGGSVDDDVKFGALASLYDDHAKYVLEIYSVRGKKYKFDLMDSTLSDGTVPRLPPRPGSHPDEALNDPFVKSLCVTVTDHTLSPVGTTKLDDNNNDDDGDDNDDGGPGDDGTGGETTTATTTTTPGGGPPTSNKKTFAVTKMYLTLESNLRVPMLDATSLPPPYLYPRVIQQTFLSLNHDPPEMAVGMPSGHRLLLDPSEAGKIYINGRYVTTWGHDPKIGSHFPSLFGMDLHSIPYWHGRIFDYDILMSSYAQLWQEIMTDARLVTRNVTGRLLSRLISGKDPVPDDDDDDDDDVLGDGNDDDDDDDEYGDTKEEKRVNTDVDCLESQVMASTKYDPVGICAKALATKFQSEYGEEGFPCLAHEIDWVKDRLPGRVPVAVPPRVIDVLRRGGYFDTKRTSDEVWFAQSRPAREGSPEETLVNTTCRLLEEAKCTDVHPSNIVFFSGEGISQPVRKKGLVRMNRAMRQYHVNEAFLTMDLAQIEAGDTMVVTDDNDGDNDGEKNVKDHSDALALLLGLHIAQEHPDGSTVIRYMLKHGKKL